MLGGKEKPSGWSKHAFRPKIWAEPSTLNDIVTLSPSTPLVAVGIGNTTLKVGLFHNSGHGWPEPVAATQMTTNEAPLDDLAAWLPAEPVAWRVASVQRQAERKLAEWVGRFRPRDEYRSLTYRDLPVVVRVESPEQVGIDRLAAAVAANFLREPDRPAIVIDTGTAITVNLVAADGAFVGGAILPGITMSARSLADNADLLPWVNAAPGVAPPPALGTSTEAAIKSGLYWGAVGAIRELGHRLTADLRPTAQWFLTGGDAAFLAPQLGAETRYVPHLVLGGIAIAARAAKH